jgi:hypothetical protein
MSVEYAQVKSVLPSLQQLCCYLPWSIYWPAEIQGEMQNARKIMVRALRRGTAVSDRKLSEKLAACRDRQDERCYLSMCPVCVERLRASFLLEGAACIAPLVQRRKFPISWWCADLPGQRYQLGDLRKINLPALNRRIRHQYLQAGIPLAISGVHLALVEDRRTNTKPIWQARVCSVIVGLAKRQLPGKLRDLFPEQSFGPSSNRDLGEALYSVIDPVFIHELTHKKAIYVERIGATVKNEGLDLPPPQMRELVHCLARYEMPVRYTLAGCQRKDDWIQPNVETYERLEGLASA